MIKLFKYFKGSLIYLWVALISIIVATTLQLLTPIMIQFTIDSIIGNEDAGRLEFIIEAFGKSLLAVIIIMIIINFLRGIFLFLKGYFSNIIAERIAKELRDKLYNRIQYMSYEKHLKTESGDIIQRCTSDVELIRRFLGLQIVELGRIVFMVIISILLMFMLNVKLTIYSVILIPILFIFSFIFFKRIKSVFTETEEAEGKLTTVLQENLSGVRVVRAFGRENFEIKKFEEVNEEYTNKFLKIMDNMAMFWSSSDFLTLIQNGLVLIIGGRMVINGEITIGVLVAFITYVYMLLWPVKQLGRILSEFGKATVALGRIEEVLEEEIEKDLEHEKSPTIMGDIEFKNVSFSYDGKNKVLDNISFKIKKGETIGILGPTGSGKSTLVNLLQRLYEYEGSILIDGVELREIKKSHIRKNIGLILQEPYLYTKNIYENIGITKRNFSKSEIINAAKNASIHDNIEKFHNGYETLVGEKGVSLSGGQKQRVAIARTIINNEQPILIFDDSLSAVDSQTDTKIRKSLKMRNRKITTIMISHRITTLSETDKILVLEDGIIIESGGHDELIKKEGFYKKVWDLEKNIS